MRNLAAALLLLMAASVQAQVLITTCGATLSSGETGVLQNDVDCSGDGICFRGGTQCHHSSDCVYPDYCTYPPAITASDGTTVELNGHTITGGSDTFGDEDSNGILIDHGVLHVHGPGRMRKFQQAIVEPGLFGKVSKIYVDQVTFDGNWTPLIGGVLSLTSVVASNNRNGISGGRVRGKDVTCVGNTECCVFGAQVNLTNVIAHMNQVCGIAASIDVGPGVASIRLVNSDVTGNGSASGLPYGLDIVSQQRRPRLRNTVCGQSARDDLGTSPWGVCTHDQ